LEVSHRLIIILRYFHFSTLFRFFLPTRLRAHSNAKFSMASTTPMDIYSPFMTGAMVVSGDRTSTWPVNPVSVKSQGFSIQSLPNIFNHRQHGTVIWELNTID
jgi:hypothetical protein